MTTAETRPPVFGVHHTAYRCRDAEETRAFYEDKLGFPMTLALEIEEEPSTGNPLKYLHIFFDIGSHKADEPNYIAFFELPDTPAGETAFAPKWGFDLHLALRVDSHADLAAWKKRLRDGGIAVKGPIDHGICSSIYFHDPNGYRLEFASMEAKEEEVFDAHGARARELMRNWTEWKASRGRAAATVPNPPARTPG